MLRGNMRLTYCLLIANHIEQFHESYSTVLMYRSRTISEASVSAHPVQYEQSRTEV